MEQENEQSTHKQATQPSAALEFVIGAVGKSQSQISPPRPKTKQVKKAAKRKQTAPQANAQPVANTTPEHFTGNEKVYVPFSTQVRRSYQRQLADLRHQREMQGAEVRTIKQFLEAAVIHWLEQHNSAVAEASETQQTKVVATEDAYEPFHNQIRKDLKLKLKEACYQRELVSHPGKTLVAVVDEAISQWLSVTLK